MSRSFPNDVIVLDTDAFLHARFGRGRANPRLVHAKPYRLAAEAFAAAPVTPQLVNSQALADALRRLRNESGKWDLVSLLLPDSWFRINIVDLPSLPEREQEAMDVVRWSLKRSMPISPEDLRVRYTVLDRSEKGAKVLILSALEATLEAIESLFGSVGLDVVLIEPLGINLWNAIAARQTGATANRLFVYVRDTDFTTAVFHGEQPLFIRSRNLGSERPIEQEIRLSASYLRDALSGEPFASCHVAGERSGAVHDTLAEEFRTRVEPVRLRDFVEEVPAGIQGFEAELTACTGVFTG